MQRHLYQWTINSAFPDADFWLIAKLGRTDQEMLGKPTREYKECFFGVLAPECFNPNYAFYLCEYLWINGFWQASIYGSSSQKYLKINEVRKFFAPGRYLVFATGNLIG